MRDIGAGNFGLVRLEKNRATGEHVAIKYIERGEKVNGAVGREIVCHRLLRHPHIVMFKEVSLNAAHPFERSGDWPADCSPCFGQLVLTPTHLALVMEFAAGELCVSIRSIFLRKHLP